MYSQLPIQDALEGQVGQKKRAESARDRPRAPQERPKSGQGAPESAKGGRMPHTRWYPMRARRNARGLWRGEEVNLPGFRRSLEKVFGECFRKLIQHTAKNLSKQCKVVKFRGSGNLRAKCLQRRSWATFCLPRRLGRVPGDALGPSWALFGGSWGALGSLLDALGRSGGALGLQRNSEISQNL